MFIFKENESSVYVRGILIVQIWDWFQSACTRACVLTQCSPGSGLSDVLPTSVSDQCCAGWASALCLDFPSGILQKGVQLSLWRVPIVTSPITSVVFSQLFITV